MKTKDKKKRGTSRKRKTIIIGALLTYWKSFVEKKQFKWC